MVVNAVKTEAKGPVVVTGASGYVGSWLVKRLLGQGYAVRATVRDPENLSKVKPLLNLPENVDGRLTIWKGDLCEEGSFDDAIDGCTAVFHIATPMDFESKDPEIEVIKPTVDGMLRIMRSCKRAKSVKRVVFTSSAGTVNVQQQRLSVYDERSWSDLEFIRSEKMTGWMYFASKTLAEKAAWNFAKENDMDLITIIPTLVVGPFISSTMPPSMNTALALITGNKPHYSILKQIQLVHLDDLCDAHIFLLEHPEAMGRYICSSHDATIFELAEMIKFRYPEYDIPTKFEGIDGSIEHVHFCSQKLLSLGFNFQYTVHDMFDGAIECCREKKLIPQRTNGYPALESAVVVEEEQQVTGDLNVGGKKGTGGDQEPQVVTELETTKESEEKILKVNGVEEQHPVAATRWLC